VQLATVDDIPAWLLLAAEVEPLFGPMIQEPSFLAALINNIQRGSAYCIRNDDDPPGQSLHGGLLFSAKPPLYRIGWLAVAQRARKQGYASSLLRHVLKQAVPPATVQVVTFGSDNLSGRPVRRLYERFGFTPAEMTCSGPDGTSRQIFRLQIDEEPCESFA
jgi:GNAT superfamily N-acetyltransferase